jgi:hypothetical protein
MPVQDLSHNTWSCDNNCILGERFFRSIYTKGSVSHLALTLQWLRDQSQIINAFPDTERAATEHNDSLYLIPSSRQHCHVRFS